MFFHKFREHFVLALELFVEKGDLPILAIAGASGARLECSGFNLEEFLLPAIEYRRADAVFITQVGDRRAFQEVKSKNCDPLRWRKALSGSLEHGQTSTRNSTLFE
jgi:hypothetical protein